MYHVSSVNHNQAGGHNHTLQIEGHDHTPQVSSMAGHAHSHGVGNSSAALVFEKDNFVINIGKGIMVNVDLTSTKIMNDDMFLDNMCDCIVSRFAGHDINIFKAGNSNELKEMILNFLKKEIE